MNEVSKNYLFRNLFLISLLVIIIISCRKYELNGDVVNDSDLIEKLYLNAKDTVEIDNQNLILETELFRDFFPGVPDRNTRLFAPIFIINTDSSVVTKMFEIKTLYVIDKDQIWISIPNSQDDFYLPVYKAFALSRNGPEWETGIYVDVVLTIEDLRSGEIKYLIARQQIITRAD